MTRTSRYRDSCTIRSCPRHLLQILAIDRRSQDLQKRKVRNRIIAFWARNNNTVSGVECKLSHLNTYHPPRPRLYCAEKRRRISSTLSMLSSLERLCEIKWIAEAYSHFIRCRGVFSFYSVLGVVNPRRQ